MQDQGEGQEKTSVGTSASHESNPTPTPQEAQTSKGNGMVSGRTTLLVNGVWALGKNKWVYIKSVFSSEKWIPILQVLSSILVAFVSIFALYQGHKNAILDERAWITASHIFEPGEVNSNLASGVPGNKAPQVNILSYGRTPALHVKVTAIVKETPDKNLPDLRSELEDKNKYLDGVRIFTPGQQRPYLPEWAENGKRTGRVYIDPTILYEVKSGQGLFVYGRVDYEDVSGAKHWITYCEQLNDVEKWASCQKYNEIDDDVSWWSRLR
jgi:hypothetical protein